MLVCDRVSECNHLRVRSPLEFSPKRHNPLTHESLYRNEDKGQPNCQKSPLREKRAYLLYHLSYDFPSKNGLNAVFKPFFGI